jgi:hypothetical protein
MKTSHRWWVHDGLRSYPFTDLGEAIDFKVFWKADVITLEF